MSKAKADAKKPDDKDQKAKHDGGWRETVESIAMAVILALLFRGFVAEAFVIPTGSMAPTLQGRHKDVVCPKCDYRYQTSGSSEENEGVLTGYHVYTTTCPICRYTQTLDPVGVPNEGSFSGDRIIVAKFAYDLAEPQRWDVIVFKYPGNAVVNYIKRLIGLPGEHVRIAGGNIYVRGTDEPEEALRIARKPPHKLNALLQLVHDTDFIPPQLTAIGWPQRWQEWTAGGSRELVWKAENGGRAYVTSGQHEHDAWLRYRHLVPSHSDWQWIEQNSGQLPSGAADRPGQLISDHYAYNAPRSMKSDIQHSWINPRWHAEWYCPPYWSFPTPTDIEQTPGPGDPPADESLGQHWVDDLAVECLAEVTGSGGELLLDLVRAGVHHECHINLADGKATLRRTSADGSPLPFVNEAGQEVESVAAATSVRGPGSYRLRLSNVDHQVLLWVGGDVVTFDGPTTYESDELVDPAWSPADPGDLSPAGIGSRGAAVKLSQLRIFRDKYYIASEGSSDNDDYFDGPRGGSVDEVFADPSLWRTSGLFGPSNRRAVWFNLVKDPSNPGNDQFLPLGDNSPASSDGRYWGPPEFDVEHHYVQRDLLIGKALLIYWPHTWNRPIPFWPNFRKMGPIR